jgi:hypothetical protein
MKAVGSVPPCPFYRKGHSRGEFVFDFARANTYAQYGLEYRPKLPSTVPFTSVSGSGKGDGLRTPEREELARLRREPATLCVFDGGPFNRTCRSTFCPVVGLGPVLVQSAVRLLPSRGHAASLS